MCMRSHNVPRPSIGSRDTIRLTDISVQAYTRTMLVTLAEAAERLGLAPVTLRLQAAKGVLRAIKVGRDWLVTEAELERYAREHMRKPRKDQR